MIVISLILGIIVCFAVPTAIAFLLRKRAVSPVKAFIIGALTFTVSQMCIRLPIIQVILPKYVWYTVLQLQQVKYGLFLGFSAGVAEEIARFIAMKYFMKNSLTMQDGIIFGVGHGGIEAMLIVGTGMINTLYYMCSTGIFVGIVSQTQVFASIAERVFAVTFHVGASLIVMYGIKAKKSVRYLALAIILHTILDTFSVVLANVLSLFWMEIIIAAGGLVTLGIGIFFWKMIKTADY